MDLNTMMDVVERILEESRGAVLSTVDDGGRPHSRWMTPVLLRGEKGALYSVTAPAMHKVDEIRANGHVAWLVQSKDFAKIVTLNGIATVVDNPALKSTVLEALGPALVTFWKINPEETELVVLETVVREATLTDTRSGTTDHVTA